MEKPGVEVIQWLNLQTSLGYVVCTRGSPIINNQIKSAFIYAYNALAKWTRKPTLAFDFRLTCVPFGHPLALTLVELNFVRSSTQVFQRLATQRKSTQVDGNSTVYVCIIMTFCNLRGVASRSVNPFGHPSYSVRKFWYFKLLSDCIELRVRLARD